MLTCYLFSNLTRGLGNVMWKCVACKFVLLISDLCCVKMNEAQLKMYVDASTKKLLSPLKEKVEALERAR